jgi:ferric-dicitrate binding protein FerR (iron transport regulator)
MTIPESDALWLRHLSGERLQAWEEQRLLRYLEDDAELREAALRDLEMDGFLRALDRSRSAPDAFLQETRALLSNEKDRTRFVNRFRERLRREPASARFPRATTRRVARAPAAPAPGPKLALIAAEFLVAAFLLWAALSPPDETVRATAPPSRRPIAWDPAPAQTAAAPAEGTARKTPEPPRSEASASSPLRPNPLRRSEPSPETAPAPLGGRHDTLPALAVVDRVIGEVQIRTEQGFIPARTGHDLMPGQILATVGSGSRASVKYPDGTRFSTRGDTLVRAVADEPGKHLSLASGGFSIEVAKQPADAPMEIVTPAARITVVGTRFSVSCSTDVTRVLVDEGRVRLSSLTRDEFVEAGGGECAGATSARVWAARPVRTYALPADWKGAKSESAQGNPYRVDGRPMWRVDQIWPDDPLKMENYTPLVWNGLFWRASEQNSGGQPSAETSEASIGLGVRMWWPDQLGSKLASLAFVAPADGVYSVDGIARTEVWEGATQRPLFLQVLRMDRKEKQMTSIASIPLTGLQFLDLQDLLVPLKAQQELIFLPQFPEKSHVACTVLFEGLKISRYPTKP